MRVRPLIYTALLAALTAACARISIPTPWGIPISLAMLGVFLSGTLLGAKWGAAAQLVYLLAGLVGLPIFSGGQAGVPTLVGPTGGYLVGYLAAAALTGALAQRGSARWMPPLAMVCGLAACYTLGTLWFMYLSQSGLAAALGLCVLPFLPGDALKITAATLITWRMYALHLRLDTGNAA